MKSETSQLKKTNKQQMLMNKTILFQPNASALYQGYSVGTAVF